jgi:predicted nucleic acid-binding protein
MKPVTLDADVIIKFPKRLPSHYLLTSVVVQELIAGAVDDSQAKEIAATAKQLDKEGRVLIPTLEDYIEAGRMLNNLLRGAKSKKSGKTPKLPAEEKHRLFRDALIARCARRAGATVVTDNLKDFKRIARYCNVTLIAGKDFFR